MYFGDTVKIDRFDGEYFEVSQHWLMDIVWNKYNMPLSEFLACYDRRDSDYILSLANQNSLPCELKYDEAHLLF